MKKTILALMVTALVATAAVGCADQTESEKEQTSTENKSQEKTVTTSPTGTESNETVPESEDETHVEIKEAFQLDGYKMLSMMALTSIAMGKSDLPLDDAQRLSLAKAINQGMAASEWKQGEPNPVIFVNGDGSSFGVGLKRGSGELQLEMFEAQTDGSYKSVKKETKPGKAK